MKNEIIFYQPNGMVNHLEIKLNDETVWLNRQQMAILFDRDIKTIGKHISSILREELKGLSVVAKFATTEMLANSSFRILEICLPIVFTSLSNNTDNCCLFSQTVSSSNLTSMCSASSFGRYKIISLFISYSF